MWQLSGAHGYKPDVESSLADMKSLLEAGFVSFDLADHYGRYERRPHVCHALKQFGFAGPAEDYVGAFKERHPELASGENVTFLTKWVPRPGPMPMAAVEQALAVSRRCRQLPVGRETI